MYRNRRQTRGTNADNASSNSSTGYRPVPENVLRYDLHDARNTLTVLLAMLEQARTAGKPAPAQAAILCQEAVHLLNDALAGRPSDEGTADVTAIVREWIEAFRATGQAKVHWHLSGDSTAPVKASPREVRRVVLNLLTNSIDAVKANEGHVRVSVKSETSGVRCIVRDDGPGVGGLQVPVGSGPAHGIGLDSVAAIMARLGGSFQLANAPAEKGGGAIAAFWLPALGAAPVAVAPELPTSAPEAYAPARSSGPLTQCDVLLVEDDPQIARFVSESLAKTRWSHLAYAAMPSGYHLDHGAVLVADLHAIPEDQWEELLIGRAIQSPLPIVVISGSERLPDDHPLAPYERVPFLTKPFTAAALQAAIAQVGRAYFDEGASRARSMASSSSMSRPSNGYRTARDRPSPRGMGRPYRGR